MAAAASLVAEAAAWRKRNFGGSGSVLGSAVTGRWQWQRQRGVGGGSVVYADNDCNGNNDNND
jgi:hypothetical protein